MRLPDVVLTVPDERLSIVSSKVASIDQSVRELVDHMVVVMKREKGAGLAAPQLGIHQRVLVLDISSYVPTESKLHVLINPTILRFSDEKWIADEGCLSMPGVANVDVDRPLSISVSFMHERGTQHVISAEGWLARGFLHEIDHLNGITLFDHIKSPLKKEIYKKKLLASCRY